MSHLRTLGVAVFVLLVASAARGQDRTQYRGYRLGNNLTSVAALAKVSATAAKTVHQRPSLIQELEWRPSYGVNGSTILRSDPVQRIVFTFYEDQLCRLVISYDPTRTEGLTDADMIDALSAVYGAALLQSSPKNSVSLAPLPPGQMGAPIAQWADAGYLIGLYRSPFVPEFRVVLTSPHLDALAQAAAAESVRLDEREAPQREAVRKQKEADETRAAREKARLANKAAFMP